MWSWKRQYGVYAKERGNVIPSSGSSSGRTCCLPAPSHGTRHMPASPHRPARTPAAPHGSWQMRWAARAHLQSYEASKLKNNTSSNIPILIPQSASSYTTRQLP